MADPEPLGLEDDAQPSETSPPLRRDLPPHPGNCLRAFAPVILLLSGAGAACLYPAVLSIPLALLLWWAAARDLAMMRTGRMDPPGEKEVAEARTCALVSLALPFVGLFCWSTFTA